MKRIAIIILVLSSPAILMAASNATVRVFGFNHVSEGTSTVFRISETLADKQSQWTPENPAPPPLSIHKASSLAIQAAEARGMPRTEWRIQECSLRRFLNDGYRDRWFYAFVFLKPKSDRPAKRESDFLYRGVVVLMDGTVVEPQTEPIPRTDPEMFR